MTDIAKIAAGLTKPQLRIVLAAFKPEWPAYVRETREHPVKNALARKGICEFYHVIAGRGDWRLTPLGLAVRDYLREQNDG